MRVILTGGGTGGHFFPSLSIAEELKKRCPDVELLYLGHDGYIESKVAPKKGIKFIHIPSRWMENYYGGIIHRASEVLLSGTNMAAGLLKARRVVKKFNPDFVIGTGGFVSLPVVLAAEGLGIRCYLHEQNAAPGRGNRMMAKKARKIFAGFPGTEESLGYPEKTAYAGNPVRDEFKNIDKSASRKALGIPEDDFVVFSVGGSLGSETINDIAIEYAKRIMTREHHTLISGLGSMYYEEYIKKATEAGITVGDKIRLSGFIDDMKNCIGAADIVICRAGAMSIAELLVAGRPSIIIPYPGSVGDHQYYNAKSVFDAGAGLFYEEKDMTSSLVCDDIDELEKDRERLNKMGEACLAIAPFEAASIICDEILADYEKN